MAVNRCVPFVVPAWLLLSVGCAFERSPPTLSTPSELAEAGHQLLTLELVAGRLIALDARHVAGPAKKTRTAAPRAWRLEVRDASGVTRAAYDLDAAGFVRGEFSNDAGELTNTTYASERVVFTARVDEVPGASSLHLLAREGSGGLEELGSSSWPVPGR